MFHVFYPWTHDSESRKPQSYGFFVYDLNLNLPCLQESKGDLQRVITVLPEDARVHQWTPRLSWLSTGRSRGRSLRGLAASLTCRSLGTVKNEDFT